MLEIRKKLISKLLVLSMCTSLISIRMAFAEETSNKQETVINKVQTIGASVRVQQENTAVDDNKLVNSSVATGSDFTFDASTETITKYIGSNAQVVIPSTINGVSVTRIGDHAFYNCSSVTGITIPDSVTSIGWHTFNGCTGLKSVTIPNSVTSISKGAFGIYGYSEPGNDYCENALFYVESENVEQLLVKSGADEGQIILNDQSSTARQSGFRFDASTGTITKYRGSNTQVVIPSTINGVPVTKIGKDAFFWCDSLVSISIPDSVKIIENGAFGACLKLESINIPNSVTSIGNYAFNSCHRLTSITIPDSVTSIGNDPFNSCEHVQFCVKSEAVKELLINCGVNESKITLNGKLSTVVVDSDGFTFDSTTGTIIDYKGTATTLVIPSEISGVSVKSIGVGAFDNCTSLASITIPDSVASIGGYAFDSCHSLANINIPNSVTSIGDGAFCTNCNTLIYVKSETLKKLLISAGVYEGVIILNGKSSLVDVRSITLNKTSLSLVKGNTSILTETVSPRGPGEGNYGVAWSSSNTAVATVDANGNVTAVGKGTAIITCAATDASNESAKCTLTVTEI